MNKHLDIAFDIDGTLIHQVGEKEDTPRYDIIDMFHKFEALGFNMIIWSGGGIDYATRWRDKLGLKADVIVKGSFTPDIAVDDMEVELGIVNIKV
jgi:hydroxymethylpyrimidine pyrophosphatase-like HAD family hydrolase